MNSSKQRWLEILQKARLFAHLSIKEIEVLAEAMFYSEFEAGKTSGAGSAGVHPLKTKPACTGSTGASNAVPYLPVFTTSAVSPAMLPPASLKVTFTVLRS